MARAVTTTGGRAATTRQISGKYALSVGVPTLPAPEGWRWVKLTDVAKLESGHTPSRRHPEYWGGEIPWIGLRDAKQHHGAHISDTAETTNELGIANSSARLLPAGTVCLSRTASVGYVTIMARSMATSQDFVNWSCTSALEPRFLQYLLIAEADSLSRFSAGAVHQTIYYPEAKAFHICLPPLTEQKRIISILDDAFEGIDRTTTNTTKNCRNARELFRSVLGTYLSSNTAWRKGNLASLVSSDCALSYGIVQPGDESENGLPIVRPTDLDKKLIRLDGLKRINPDKAKGYRRTQLKGGELLLCVRGTTGLVSIASDELTGGNVTRGIVPIRFDPTLVSPMFGYYLLISDAVQSKIRNFTYGAALMQINIRDLRSIELHYPSIDEQQALVRILDSISTSTDRLHDIYSLRLSSLSDLKASVLAQAFSGRLSRHSTPPVIAAKRAAAVATASVFGAKILMIAHHRHVAKQREATFGRVKAQKTLHLVESVGGIDLGREPIKDAAGPNDSLHQRRIEDWARENKIFEFVKRGNGYDFRKLSEYDRFLATTLVETKSRQEQLDRVIVPLVPMNSEQAEVIATVHAAWNNLILDGHAKPSDSAIVKAARDDWHESKLKIPEAKFRKGIEQIRKLGWVPDGSAKRVMRQERLL